MEFEEGIISHQFLPPIFHHAIFNVKERKTPKTVWNLQPLVKIQHYTYFHFIKVFLI